MYVCRDRSKRGGDGARDDTRSKTTPKGEAKRDRTRETTTTNRSTEGPKKQKQQCACSCPTRSLIRTWFKCVPPASLESSRGLLRSSEPGTSYRRLPPAGGARPLNRTPFRTRRQLVDCAPNVHGPTPALGSIGAHQRRSKSWRVFQLIARHASIGPERTDRPPSPFYTCLNAPSESPTRPKSQARDQPSVPLLPTMRLSLSILAALLALVSTAAAPPSLGLGHEVSPT